MKQIGVQFSDRQMEEAEEMAKAAGLNRSMVIRAAVQIGLDAISERDAKEAARFIAVQDAIARN